jgi:hypothetical protein
MTTKIVKPMPGFVVLDPYSLRRVPEEGAIVPWNSYWVRRVNEGSLKVVEPEVPAPKKARKSKTESTEDTEQ